MLTDWKWLRHLWPFSSCIMFSSGLACQMCRGCSVPHLNQLSHNADKRRCSGSSYKLDLQLHGCRNYSRRHSNSRLAFLYRLDRLERGYDTCVFVFYPETAGRTLEDMDDYYRGNPPLLACLDKEVISSKRLKRYQA
ncbi:hypothetical protein V1523DRAFT_167460 [Lipomyces doorenjongii]